MRFWPRCEAKYGRLLPDVLPAMAHIGPRKVANGNCALGPGTDWPHNVPRSAPKWRPSAFLLEECLVYLAVSSVLLGLTFAAYYRVMENAKGVRRNAADIARVLQAGERWREDIRRASGPLKLVTLEGGVEQAFHVPQSGGEVIYLFTGTNVLRQAGLNARWTETLARVKASQMNQDRRERVVAWRWEVELNAGRKKPLVRPLFTFLAVPNQEKR